MRIFDVMIGQRNSALPKLDIVLGAGQHPGVVWIDVTERDVSIVVELGTTKRRIPDRLVGSIAFGPAAEIIQNAEALVNLAETFSQRVVVLIDNVTGGSPSSDRVGTRSIVGHVNIDSRHVDTAIDLVMSSSDPSGGIISIVSSGFGPPSMTETGSRNRLISPNASHVELLEIITDANRLSTMSSAFAVQVDDYMKRFES